MSQEIQLSLPNQGLPQAANSWSGPAPMVLGPAVKAPQTPLAKLHQHLRGRYGLTVLFAIVFAAMGTAAGVLIPHPSYQSIGRIKIDPRIKSPELADKIMPLWQAYVQTVVENLHSERVITVAMQSPEWKAHRKGPPDEYFSYWSKNLVVKVVPNSFDIAITFTDDHKDGQVVAPIAVKSLIKAYVEMYGDEEKKEFEEKKAKQVEKDQLLTQKVDQLNAEINQRLSYDGEDLQSVFSIRSAAHTEMVKDLRHLEEDLKVNQSELATAEAEGKTTPASIEDFARVDAPMQEMFHIKAQLELAAKDLENRLGTKHPATLAAYQQIQTRKAAMEEYCKTLNAKFFIKVRPDGTSSEMKRDLSVEIATVDRMRKQLAVDQGELEDISTRGHKVKLLREQKDRLEQDQRRVHVEIDELTARIGMANNLEVIDQGGHAMIASDKRIAFGAIGLLVGGGIPVGLMLLISLMNPRFRYSDEASSQTASGLTLLGILPDLPDRLSDPEQASIAAHCVHQIRTMLQINNGTDERRVFAITSAAPGDGKTSLTLALGLSYAACGTRTLLVDCDLIGAGLTSRMNVTAADGVLEAIAHRSLLEYVRNTDIADVSILPVGTSQHLHASTLSPAALRRLIEEAKKHFDTILVDTGPVLGSIEASLVAAAADAVVLTVSRGQQRPLVEKTIQHLKNIKANLAGIVFNRAQTADFDSSISGLSLRSTGGGSGNSMRMGPVARAVQSAFKPAGEDVN